MGRNFLLEHFLENTEDDFELLIGVLGKFHVDAVWDRARALRNSCNQLSEVSERRFGSFVHFVDFVVKAFVGAEKDVLAEKVYTRLGWRVEVGKFEVENRDFVGLFGLGAHFELGQRLNRLFEKPFYLQNRPLLIDLFVPKELNENLGNDVEVLFIAGEDLLHLSVNRLNQFQFKLILRKQLHDLQYFPIQRNFIPNLLFTKCRVNLFELIFELIDELPKSLLLLFVHVPRLPPSLSLLLEFSNILPQKGLITIA